MLKFEGNSAHDPCVKKLTALGPGHSLTKAKKLHALFSYFDVLEFSLWSGPYLLSLYTGSRHLRFEDHIHWNYKKITLCRLYACCHVVIQSQLFLPYRVLCISQIGSTDNMLKLRFQHVSQMNVEYCLQDQIIENLDYKTDNWLVWHVDFC